MDREQARETVKEYLECYLESKGINTRKPFTCLSPEHNDKHPSMSYDRRRQRCKCFACGASYDIFDIIGIDYGLTDPGEIFRKAYDMFNITIDATDNMQPRKAAKPVRKEAKPEGEGVEKFIEEASASFVGSPAEEYLETRGISPDTAKAYGMGYNATFSTAEVKEDGSTRGATWRALIIPTGSGSYVARNIDTPKEQAKKNRYRKKGASLIFNSKALYTSGKSVFVVEGELDALSIIEAGGLAIGLGSTSNYGQLVNLVKEKKPEQPLILALDTDEEGQATEDKLAQDLTKAGVSFYRVKICGQYKDANEALVNDRQGFIESLRGSESIQEAELEAAKDAAKEEYLKESAAAHINSFKAGINASVNTPAIKTGFYNLDEALDGGLYEGLYIIGAISSLGKTTFALQVADNLAEQGQDVIIFSLEMARAELMAKSISRLTYLLADDPKDAKTTRGITAGARYAGYSKKEKEIINKAIEQYAGFSGCVFIHEGVGDLSVKQVRETIERHISITGRKPVVIIDYLQILAPYDIRSNDKQNTDKSVLELKRISRDHKIPVIAISSFNRDSYKAGGGVNQGRVSMTDFKESGALEYSADVLMGLEFESAGSKEYDEKAEKKKDPRQIRLVILKQRNGRAWESASFNYYPLFNYYETKAPEPTSGGDIFKELRAKKAK